MAGLENQITAIQNRIDIERNAGRSAIDLINEKAVIEEKLFKRKMETTNEQEKEALQIEKTNKLYQTQVSIFGDINTQIQSVSDTLTTAFGSLGTAIGGSIKAIVESSQQLDEIDTKYANAKKSAGGDAKKLAELEIAYSKDRTKAEVKGLGTIAGETKKMFNEKSAGYKILAKVEKAAAAVSLAIKLRDMAMDIKAAAIKVYTAITAEAEVTAAKAAAAPAQVAADSPGILSSFAKLGPWGYAAGAAIVAMLLSMVGGGSKGKMIDMTGLTSEDRQATQGTGQSYVNGVRVDNGGGVFGDSSAKSTAIVDSLAILADNSIVGLN